MSDGWAMRLARVHVPALARLRLHRGIEVTETPEAIWIRGREAQSSLSEILSGIPADARYHWRSDNILQPTWSRIPSERLPGGEWRPLAQWLGVSMRTPRGVAPLNDRIPLKLQRSSRERASNLMVLPWVEWRMHAKASPEIRLRQWTFAVNARLEVIVRGLPLPQLTGSLWVEENHIATPAGFEWFPQVSPEVVRRLLGIPQDCLALWHLDNTISPIRSELFIEATRPNLAATDASLRGDS